MSSAHATALGDRFGLAANAWNFWDLFRDARLYWPRFVRVRVSPN